MLSLKKMSFSVAVCAFTMLCGMTAWAGDRFISGTYVNGISLSGKTVDEAKTFIESVYSDNYKIVLDEKSGNEIIYGKEIGYKVSAPTNLQDILNDENAKNLIPSPISRFDYQAAGMNATYSEEALNARIASLNVLKNITKTSNAYITPYQAGQPYKVVAEVNGNSLDQAKLTAAIKEALAGGTPEINLMTQGIYDTVTVTSASLQDLCGKLNQLKGMTVTYNIAGNKEVLGTEQISSWITGSTGNAVAIDQAQAAAYVASLAAKYDTAGGVQTWNSASGKAVSLKTSYGFRIDQAQETQALIAAIQGLTSVEREPIYAKKGVQMSMPQFGNTFVEVNLGNQHAYYYKDMQCVWDAPIVSGKATDPDRVTPTGVYSIQYKQTDRVLKGPIKNGKPEYESHVDYWMPFNGGIGLHDASWRSTFGGSIYVNNGSHGCINLPSAKAKALYDMISTGTIVVVVG